MLDIGSWIKNTRKLIGMTQQELAEKTGISMMSIRRYESGERIPKLETIKKIEKVLDLESSAALADLNANMSKMVEFATKPRPEFIESTAKLFNHIVTPNKKPSDKQPDILPAEFNEFSIFIEKMGYYISLDNDQYYLAKDDERKKITVDELKSLVRTSKTVISGLLDDMMHRE